MAGLFWKRELEKKFEKETAPKIRKLEVEYGDSHLSRELRQMKIQMDFNSPEQTQRTLDVLDKVASHALEVYENEYKRIYKPVIEGLADDGKVEKVKNFFENEEKLSIALRIYSQVPIQRIDALREQIRVKEQMSRKYVRLIRENATADCSAIHDTLELFLMDFEKAGDHKLSTRSESGKAELLNVWENIKWVANLIDKQKKLEKKANELENNNKNLLDLLIFTQRHLTKENLDKLIDRISQLDIVKPGLTSREIEKFLPNLFLEGNMTDREKRFCIRMRNSLAKCVYEKLSQIFPV
jgi:hypothetical protein